MIKFILDIIITAIEVVALLVHETARFLRNLTNTPSSKEASHSDPIKTNDITFTLRGGPRAEYHIAQLKTGLSDMHHVSLCLDLGMKIIQSCETIDDVLKVHDEYCSKARPILALPKPSSLNKE